MPTFFFFGNIRIMYSKYFKKISYPSLCSMYCTNENTIIITIVFALVRTRCSISLTCFKRNCVRMCARDFEFKFKSKLITILRSIQFN